jgi:hypothetical protein
MVMQGVRSMLAPKPWNVMAAAINAGVRGDDLVDELRRRRDRERRDA